MRVKGITVLELNYATSKVNRKYNNNIIFNRTPEQNGNYIVFTLKCRDSKEPGHRLHINTWGGKDRHGISACWHVHGDLFDAIWDINPDAIICTGSLRMESKEDNWQNRNIGSRAHPVMFSLSCEC